VIIARNRQDEAEERIRALRAALDQLDERQGRSEKRLSSSAGRASRVSALRKVTRAEQDYLEARLDVAESDADVAEQEVVTSRARLDLVKQRQLVRIGKVTFAARISRMRSGAYHSGDWAAEVVGSWSYQSPCRKRQNSFSK